MLTTIGNYLSLEGQTALVTGASRGIGASIAAMLASAGAFVIINFRSDDEAAQKVLTGIHEAGGRAALSKFDVSNSAAVDSHISACIKDYGPVDILVNNAGISRDGLVGRLKDDDWNLLMAVNLDSVFYTCRAIAKSMIRNRKGRIVNISSTAGELGNAGQVNYSAAKAGIIGLTKALARELAPRNVLVNAVAPGIIQGGLSDHLDEKQTEAITAHVPLRRLGDPQDAAFAVLFLCSPMASYITGQVIRVNGGLYM